METGLRFVDLWSRFVVRRDWSFARSGEAATTFRKSLRIERRLARSLTDFRWNCMVILSNLEFPGLARERLKGVEAGRVLRGPAVNRKAIPVRRQTVPEIQNAS